MAFYMVKSFSRFARSQRIPGASLVAAGRRVVEGHADADLGGGLYKQGVARPGAGKSGGYRTVLAHRAHGHVFFLFGFAKNARATISSRETRALAAWGDVLAELDAEQLATALRAGELQVLDDDQDS